MMNFEENQFQKKEFYNFKEIVSYAGVKPYVLRFWESEFEEIKPLVQGDGSKLYTASDLEFIQGIKQLLFVEKLSIPQAKHHLAKIIQEKNNELNNTSEDSNPPEAVTSQLSSLELMKKALHIDFNNTSEVQTEKQTVKSFNDEDVINLVQAKKRLNKLMIKMDDIIKDKGWTL